MAIEYAYDIELSKDKKTLILSVELPQRELARDPILECDDSNALEIIKTQGFGGYVLSRGCGHLTNWVSRDGKGGERKGEWIFEKVTKPKAAAKKTTTKKPAAKKTTKTS